MTEQNAQQDNHRTVSSVGLSSNSTWLRLEEEVAELRTYSAALFLKGEKQQAEIEAVREQVASLRRALAALRDLSRQSADVEVLRMAIDELADAAGSER